jgi:hypothetical protein
MLSWGGATDQIENASSLARDLSFSLLDWRVPLICITESDVPNSEREVFNNLKRSLKLDRTISSYWAARLSQSIYL